MCFALSQTRSLTRRRTNCHHREKKIRVPIANVAAFVATSHDEISDAQRAPSLTR
jgi:hypothetical protein